MQYLAQILVFSILTYLYASLVEYLIHRFLMHVKQNALPQVFDGHMLHHQMYSRGRFINPKLLSGKYKNLVVCLEHIFIFVLPLALLVLPWFPLWSFILLAFGVGHYFAYNHLHAAMHLNRPPRFFPRWYAEACYWTHLMHHSHPLTFYNVALPGMDYLFRTVEKPSWADEKRWHDLKKVMYPEVNKKSLAQDKEIIKSLNDCIFPSKYSDVGFVGPAPEGRADKAGQVISNLLVNTFVGDTQICYIGAQYPEVAVYAFSHRKWADVFVIRKYFPKVRLAAAQSVMQFMGGLLGLILGPLNGCFAVASGKGVAVKTAVKLLKSKEPIGICPEAWAYMDDAPLRPFHNGAVRMAAGAGVPIVPVYIKYGSYAPKCFNKLPFVLQVVLNCLDPLQRATAFIVVGEPYTLPADCDVEEETLKLYDKVCKLEPRM